MNQAKTRKQISERENTMNPDAALMEMRKMFAELKTGLKDGVQVRYEIALG